MPDFIIKLAPDLAPGSVNLTGKKYTSAEDLEDNHLYVTGGETYYSANSEFCGIIIGDFVLEHGSSNMFAGGKDFVDQISGFKGFYYYIQYVIQSASIEFYNGMFGILPIYISGSGKNLWISSNIELILQASGQGLDIDNGFLLEQAYFNYAFRDRTPFKQIKTLPANHYLEYTGNGYILRQHTDIEEIFRSNIISWRSSIHELADLFIEESRSYFPDEPFIITMTGGFDGRTLASVAYRQKCDFSLFSFGTSGNPDLFIPKEQAELLGIRFYGIDLSRDYIENGYLTEATDMIRRTGGYPAFLHAHFPYSAKILGSEFNTLINGMFGSEIFRALHIQGMVTSSALVSLFSRPEKEDFRSILLENPVSRFLNLDGIRQEFEELVDHCMDFRSGMASSKNINHLFYKYIFEESFRKYFGPQIVSQLPYIKIRSPFLDYNFIRRILQTDLAGANEPFFTHNPLNRYKGQLFYANLINYCMPQLARLQTGKGYKPHDLMTPSGWLRTGLNYLRKRVNRYIHQENLDNLAIVSSTGYHRNFIDQIPVLDSIYNKDEIRKVLNSPDWIRYRDDLLKIMSVNYYFSQTP